MAKNNSGKKKQLFEIRERLYGASKTAPTGERKAVAKANHFKGKDPQKWVTNIPTFNSVNMGETYAGISLKLQAHGNNVEKIFAIRPGADSKIIRLNIDGATALRMTTKGELEVNTDDGSLRFKKPVAYQRIDGRKIPVKVSYSVKGRSYGFKLAAYDQTKELIIDPLITAVFQGSIETQSRVTCMATDSNGNIYVAGRSSNHLAVLKYDGKLKELLDSTIDDAYDRAPGSFRKTKAFIARLDNNLQNLLASTLLGDTGDDDKLSHCAYEFAIDTDGNVVVAGGTQFKIFP